VEINSSSGALLKVERTQSIIQLCIAMRARVSEALGYYERALMVGDQPEEEIAKIHLNISASKLRLEFYCEAYEHAKRALEGGADKAKALFR
jgi:tetratricopeptide (TPR) repeat protein